MAAAARGLYQPIILTIGAALTAINRNMISDGAGNYWDLDSWNTSIRQRPPREKLREPYRIYKSNQTYEEDLADVKLVNVNDTIID